MAHALLVAFTVLGVTCTFAAAVTLAVCAVVYRRERRADRRLDAELEALLNDYEAHRHLAEPAEQVARRVELSSRYGVTFGHLADRAGD